jgi:hypothetical protein
MQSQNVKRNDLWNPVLHEDQYNYAICNCIGYVLTRVLIQDWNNVAA